MTLFDRIDQRITECLSDIASQRRMIQSYREAKRFLRQNTFKVGDLCLFKRAVTTFDTETWLIRIVRFNELKLVGELLAGRYSNTTKVSVWYDNLMSGDSTLKLAKKEDMALFIGMPYKSEAFEKILRKG